MAARGWVVLCWDLRDQALRVYNADAHNQGGVWACLPILVLDVYEHAYFMDYGSDRKAYIGDWWKNLNWNKANELFAKAKQIGSY
jgi:Fe-Mn family superoxide dismutase